MGAEGCIYVTKLYVSVVLRQSSASCLLAGLCCSVPPSSDWSPSDRSKQLT